MGWSRHFSRNRWFSTSLTLNHSCFTSIPFVSHFLSRFWFTIIFKQIHQMCLLFLVRGAIQVVPNWLLVYVHHFYGCNFGGVNFLWVPIACSIRMGISDWYGDGFFFVVILLALWWGNLAFWMGSNKEWCIPISSFRLLYHRTCLLWNISSESSKRFESKSHIHTRTHAHTNTYASMVCLIQYLIWVARKIWMKAPKSALYVSS